MRGLTHVSKRGLIEAMQNPDKLEREGEMPPLDFGPKGGLRIKPFKDGVSQYMQSLGYNGYVQHGLVEYFTRLQNRIKQNDEQAPERVFEEFISEFQVVTENRSFNKARGFNYIHDDPNYENVLDQVLYNAKTMIETMGLDFFNSGTSKRPDQIWSAQIPNTTFRLNLEPGAGAGTFSLNFSISLDELGDTGRGKIWSMAMDFEQEDEELVARIIVTGSRVRLANLGASHKKDRYKDFAKEVGRTTSQRLLTFLCMYLAYDLGATKFKALSTEGAYKLSSLKRSKGKYD